MFEQQHNGEAFDALLTFFFQLAGLEWKCCKAGRLFECEKEMLFTAVKKLYKICTGNLKMNV